jgi:hypothetical protein
VEKVERAKRVGPLSLGRGGQGRDSVRKRHTSHLRRQQLVAQSIRLHLLVRQ